ncbi:2-oxoadipate dioxygenase/decarboxylase [Mycolicibacterium komossense]|uniref:2-oxoadipate dioxygenase/decarboxylase n=1 Tax=Mycolicibacterium komossense TaxID=1779 RepID=A0ABT3CKJ2_9MYCO|nr:VOC family protein [Mycolicibacterium komossense]MCV7230048.1 VOC family protein [Mycolicibacterium komossense]
MTVQTLSQLRTRFAAALSTMYGREVPAYTTLVEVATEINSGLGGNQRVTAERHGAIRVGTPEELRQVGQVFRGFGMHPVGFYDLRDTGNVPVPVVSTAFRPIDENELERNPFRVFTSMLTVDDERFFSAELRGRLEAFLAKRTLFSPELLTLAARSAEGNGLTGADADRFVELATAAFELSPEPTDRAWYSELAQINAVAADIGGVTRTHINHLTPRVLDIDELYRRLGARGLQMIDKIQGPPRWNGPDVLLRQTSFRALDETRLFVEPDGTVAAGTTRVRFGEVEQRGIALTPAGRQRYDTLMAATDAAAATGLSWQEAGRSVWEASDFPTDELGLHQAGLGYFTYSASETGTVAATPIVYEDFLPRSAAGIFQSNLTDDGSMDGARAGAYYDIDWLAGTLGCEVHAPDDLYAAQSRRSLRACAEQLGLDPSQLTATTTILETTDVR